MTAMTTPTADQGGARSARAGYGFRTVAAMEWRKLRTVRSTWYMLAALAASLVLVSVLALGHEDYAGMSAADRAAFDPVHDCFIGLVLGQLLAGTLGVLTVTPEFSSGMIRATFAAVPGRPLVLAAKAAVLGGVTLAVGEAAAFTAFFAGQAQLPAAVPHGALGQPGALRAVLLAGAYPALVALIGLAFGAFIRHTAGALCALVGVLFVLPLLFVTPSLQAAGDKFLPHAMANTMTALHPGASALPPGLTFALLCGYALAALALGAWALTRHDA
jgi:ABC-2 type transport system permease protein